MPGQDEHPEIPSFKPVQKEERKGGGVPLPELGKSGFPGLAKSGVGGLKVRGLPAGGATLVERLKRLRKKDFAFIAAGLAVLMMAPVAEHFLISPEEEMGVLKQGFSTPGEGSTLFPDGQSVYESGTGGLSPGSLYGSGTDVITPLNVRDPSALIMTAGAQKPAAMTPTESAAPPAKEERGGWKDALAQAASAGVKQAIQKSPKLPRPDVKMSGALRGLQAAQGGGGGSYALPALSASKVPNRATESNALSRAQAVPGYRGAASRSSMSGGGPESLKAAGARQADIFNKGGSAGNNLDQAAREAIPGGQGSSESSYGRTPEDKSTGNNGKEGDKSLGESLALMRAKMEMQKAIDLKWKKKEWYEFGRRQMIEKMMIESGFKMFEKAIIDPVGKAFSSFFETMLASGASSTEGWICVHPDSSIATYTKAAGYYVVGLKVWKKVGDTPHEADQCKSVQPWPGTTGTGTGTTTPDPSLDTDVSTQVDPLRKTQQGIEGLGDPYGKLGDSRKKALEAYNSVSDDKWSGKKEWKTVLDSVTNGELQLKNTQGNFRQAQDSSIGAQDRARSVNAKLGTEQGLVKAMADGSKGVIGDLEKALATGTGDKVTLDQERFNALVQKTSDDVRDKGKAQHIGAAKTEMTGAEAGIDKAKTSLEAAVGPVDGKTGQITGEKDGGSLGKARENADAAMQKSKSLSNEQTVVSAEGGDAAVAIVNAVSALNQAVKATDPVKAQVQKDYSTAKDQVTKSRSAYDATGLALEAVLQAPVDGLEMMSNAWEPVYVHNGKTVAAANPPQDPAKEVSKTSLQSNFEKVSGGSKSVLGVSATKPGEKPPAQAPAADRNSVAGLLSAAAGKLKTAVDAMQAVRQRK